MGLAQNVNDPSVDLGALVGYKNGYLPSMDQWQLNWVFSAGVSMPLFDGFKAGNQIKEAEASLMAAKMKTEDIHKGLVTEIKQAISDVQTNYEKLKAAELHVKLAEDAVSQSKVRFDNGVITNLDLINAETSLAKARLLHSQAQFSYVMSDYALKRAAGMKIWKETTEDRGR